MLQVVSFLLVLVVATQSVALTVSVTDPLVPGQIAISTWTRNANEPSKYVAVLHSLTGASPDISFPVDSNGKLSWQLSAQIPSNFKTGSYVLFAFDRHIRNPFATSNTFTVGPLGNQNGQTASTPPISQPAVAAPSNNVNPPPSSPPPSSPPTLPSLPSGSNTINSPSFSNTNSQSSFFIPGGSSTTPVNPLKTTVGATIPSTVDATASPSSSTDAVAGAAAASTSSTNTPVVVGSVLGSLIALALIAVITVIIVRRYRRKQGTVQFYDDKMVRPRDELDPSYSPHSYGTASTPGHSYPQLRTQTGYPVDVKMEPEPLPEYGYSNIDIVEKADYYRHPYTDAGSSSPWPRGAQAVDYPSR